MDIEEERIPLSNNGFNGEWIINSSIEKQSKPCIKEVCTAKI